MYHVGKRKKGTATYPIYFRMMDSTAHYTPKTGLAPTVTLSKNGAAAAAASGAVTEIGTTGVYVLAGHAADRDTTGSVLLHAVSAGADNCDVLYDVVEYDPMVPYDSGAVVADAGNGAATFMTNLSSATDDKYINRWLKMTSGPISGEQRRISDYNGTTKVVTLSSAFTDTPGATETFILLT